MNRDDFYYSFSEQSNKENYQQNWLLSNLLPQSKTESVNSADGSPVRNREETASPNMNHSPDGIDIQKVSSPQQKPVNLLPEVPMQTSRKLSDREQRDCDVIGKKELIVQSFEIYDNSIKFDIFFQRDS